MVLVQIWLFFQVIFLGNNRQKNVFYDILKRKSVFLEYKNRKFKKTKNNIFSKGLTHGFGPKMGIFPAFFYLGNKRQKNIFYDILERKNVFLEYKNKKFKKTKKWHFSKGVNPWFWSKNGHISNFIFHVI